VEGREGGEEGGIAKGRRQTKMGQEEGYGKEDAKKDCTKKKKRKKKIEPKPLSVRPPFTRRITARRRTKKKEKRNTNRHNTTTSLPFIRCLICPFSMFFLPSIFFFSFQYLFYFYLYARAFYFVSFHRQANQSVSLSGKSSSPPKSRTHSNHTIPRPHIFVLVLLAFPKKVASFFSSLSNN
jgi:hypothetical protein